MNSKSNPQPVYSVDEARAAVLEAIPRTTQTERVPVVTSVDRILAEKIIAAHDIPPFRNSAMDGYAIRFSDYQSNVRFEVIGKSLAGHPYNRLLEANTAVKITTGAMVPDNADTIVIQENTTREGDAIKVEQPPTHQAYIRNIGDDISIGTGLITPGTRLTPAHTGLLAAQGMATVDVYRLPRIAVFSTGDELVEPGQHLRDGAIFDSNRTTISALLHKAGFPTVDLGILKDDEQALRSHLAQLDAFDFVISSGGVSVGEADHMKAALEATGSLSFWKVAMKPGKPLVTGRLTGGAHYFGLPGNPVSGMVTCLQFVVPALLSHCGLSYEKPKPFRARCDSTLIKEAGRFEYQRGVYSINKSGNPVVTTTGMQDSHVLHSMSSANCFICLEPSSTGVSQGEDVPIVLFDALLGVAG
jgi:molybdopterin molybdotransferase